MTNTRGRSILRSEVQEFKKVEKTASHAAAAAAAATSTAHFVAELVEVLHHACCHFFSFVSQ
jgi:hypothetical protein